MEWVWELYKGYVTRHLARAGVEAPTDEELETTFLKVLSESTVTVLVQEPWQNSVRFKGLARYAVQDRLDLLSDPMHFLKEQFGGGKFKLNFHQGWNFVGTQNFKPQGAPKWNEMPGIDF